MNKINNIIWGVLLIILGFIWGLNALEITDIDIFFDGWWTLFIILPSLMGLIKDHDKMSDMIGLLIGVALLLVCQDILSMKIIIKLCVPLLLILIGISLIFKGTINRKIKEKIMKINNSSLPEYGATFSEEKLDFSNQEFKGCSLNAIFGGTKCTLLTSKIKDDVLINATAVFGGITIFVPDDVNVKITSTSIFGGVSDERKIKNNDNKYTIYINATCLFGGVEIK